MDDLDQKFYEMAKRILANRESSEYQKQLARQTVADFVKASRENRPMKGFSCFALSEEPSE